MSIAIAKNHMAEMNMLGMLAVLDKTLADATRDKISYRELERASYRHSRCPLSVLGSVHAPSGASVSAIRL